MENTLEMRQARAIIMSLKAEGLSISAIARFCSVDRKTVYAWLYGWWEPSYFKLPLLQQMLIKQQDKKLPLFPDYDDKRPRWLNMQDIKGEDKCDFSKKY